VRMRWWIALCTAAVLLATGNVQAGQKVSLVLNWVPTADHSPFFYAYQQGWYERAGIELDIEFGRGSALSAQKVGAGASEFGIADLPTAFVARSKGANLQAVMAIYANSPQGFYWLKSSGISGPADFPGRKIGNPPGDAARVMWPAFAAKAGIDPRSVTWVNVSPQAKVPSLKSRAIDVTTDFYNEHDVKVREFGADLGFLAWRAAGLNLYGNALIVNGEFLAEQRDTVHAFVRVTQRAFGACVADAAPCLKALMAAASGLELATQQNQWQRVKELMRDPTTQNVALGAFDTKRLKDDYAMVRTSFGMDRPFDPQNTAVNDFLDTSIRMPAQ
jgi:NitT/TauT family transport system substrate-binding protein